MNIKINPETKTEVSDNTEFDLSVKPETVTASEMITKTQEENLKSVESSFKDKTPSNWSIKPTEDGIEARSNSTGETFVGTIIEFNQKLRG